MPRSTCSLLEEEVQQASLPESLPAGGRRQLPVSAIGQGQFLGRSVLVGLAVLVLAGCQSDEITRYRVTRPEKKLNRFLGAIIPHGNKTWFVKLTGPEKAVAAEEKRFHQFVASIRFPAAGKSEIAWNAPEGWRQEPGQRQGRFATLQVGPEDHPLELTVTALGAQGLAASVPANVNRWRGQMGLRPVAPDEIPKVTQELKLEGATATLVDITGPGGARMGGGPPPMLDNLPPLPEAEPASLTYTTPPGWKELPAGGFRKAAFKVVEGDQEAEVTVIPLGGQAGSILANVNRWRGQLGLEPVDEAQLQKDLHMAEVAGQAAPYVDLTGPEKAGGRQRTLAAALLHGGQTWFFKITGAAELVGRQRNNFERFLASVHFPQGGGN
jgi:hypothetical protein